MTAQTMTRARRFPLPDSAHLAVLVLPLAVYLLALSVSTTFATFFAVGSAVGFTLQRARLCFVSAFRDMYMLHQGRTMRGLLVGLAVGLALVYWALPRWLVTPESATPPPGS